MTKFRVLTALALGLAAGQICSAQSGAELPPELRGFNIAIDWYSPAVPARSQGGWDSSKNPESITSVVPGGKEGTWTISGGWEDDNFAADWVIDVDIDPGVSSSFNVTNSSGSSLIYSIAVFLPVPALGGPTVMDGKMSGNLLDADLDGSATVSTIPGSALYRAMVDLVGVHDEYADPYSLSTLDIDPLPVVTWGPLPGPGITSSIGIQNQFELTDGDTFQMVNIFRINAIPAPGALALAGFAGLAVIRRRR